MEPQAEPLTREGFDAWLASLPDDVPAGTRDNCPLGCYLCACGYQASQVGAEVYLTGEPHSTRRLPAWAWRFVRWSDSAMGGHCQRWAALTAGACRAWLLALPPLAETSLQGELPQ